MGQPARKEATYEDLFDLPDNMVGEIVGGELYASPRPSFAQALVKSVLVADLGAPFVRSRGGPGGWWILNEPELHFGRDVVVPDLAGWRRSRMPAVHKGPFHTLAPDWICEVLSPDIYVLDRVRKLPIYAREGVSHAWLVEPIERTLELYRLEGERWVVVGAHGDDERVRGEPFEAVELDLLALWGEEREDGAEGESGSEPGEGG